MTPERLVPYLYGTSNRILVIGAPQADVEGLTAQGFTCTVVQLDDLLRLQSVAPGRYAGFWCPTALSYLNPPNLARALQCLQDSLTRAAVGFIGLAGDEWPTTKFLFALSDADFLLLEQADGPRWFAVMTVRDPDA